MLIGLLLLAAALCICIHNLYEEQSAGKESEEVLFLMDQLNDSILQQLEQKQAEQAQQIQVVVPDANTPVPVNMFPSVVHEAENQPEQETQLPEPSAIPVETTVATNEQPSVTAANAVPLNGDKLIAAATAPVNHDASITQAPRSTPLPTASADNTAHAAASTPGTTVRSELTPHPVTAMPSQPTFAASAATGTSIPTAVIRETLMPFITNAATPATTVTIRYSPLSTNTKTPGAATAAQTATPAPSQPFSTMSRTPTATAIPPYVEEEEDTETAAAISRGTATPRITPSSTPRVPASAVTDAPVESTATASATAVPVQSLRPQLTATPTRKPTATSVPTYAQTNPPEILGTPSVTAAEKATATPAERATATPSMARTNSPKPIATATPKATSTAASKATSTTTPAAAPKVTPTVTATVTPTPTPTVTPTPIPTPTPTATPTTTPTITPRPTSTLPDYVKYPDMEIPEVVIGKYAYIGKLSIPSIGISLPVMSDWSYVKLNVAPCRYSGTPYRDNFIIMGHNYATHFANLKNLVPGDRVSFTDMTGNVFEYVVDVVEKIDSENASGMMSSGYPLSLFTCNLYSTARVTVRCRRAE